MTARPLWAGRMRAPLDERLLAFSRSLPVDRALFPYDVAASRAHVAGLAAQDPNFKAQLGGFRFGNWMDVVDLEANELATQFYTGPA